MTSGLDRVFAVVGIVTIVAGIVLVAASGSFTVQVVGWVLMAAGVTVLIGLAFLLVGESEDRDRKRHPNG